MSDSSKNLQMIFDLEIERLAKTAKHGSLEMEDVKKLGELTRAYRTFNTTVSKSADDEEDITLTTDELIAIATGSNK